MRPSHRRRAAAATIATTLLLAACTGPAPRPTNPPTGGTTPAPTHPRPTPTSTGAAASWTPVTHLHAARGFMGDAQRPVYVDGTWHFYYLWNGDWPDGNGTEWRHATSTDLVHWTDRGVAVEKYHNGLGDIETGSVVVDRENTAGLGRGALIALVTQRADGVQRQSLFSSTDGGNHFDSYPGNPVLDNPTGHAEFRDPKVLWDDARHRWVMLLAEDTKIGLYTSPDLKTWHYESGFSPGGLGTLECPDLFRIDLDGDPARSTWVLGAGANGFEQGRSTGYAYWTGSFDGSTFTPDDDTPQWLDGGADFYAAVTFTDRSAGTETGAERRYVIGWMGNWDYQQKLPTTGRQGQMTVTRELRLRTVDGRPTLTQSPLLGGTYPDTRYTARTLRPEGTEPLPARAAGAARLVEATLVPRGGAVGITVHASANGRQGTRVWYDPGPGELVVTRSRSGTIPDASFRPEQRVKVALADGRLPVRVVVDRASVEVFAGEHGEAAITDAVFPGPASTHLRVDGAGRATVEDLRVLAPRA